MRKSTIAVACLSLLVFGTGAIVAAEPAKPAAPAAQPQMSPEMQAEMEAWMKMGTPGKEHEQLASSAGHWKATGKSYMGGPEPVTFEGTTHRQVMFGNRVLAESFKAEMMGMPFEGHGMMGYDNARKQWWSTWNDSMSTGVLLAYGNWDDKEKAIVMKGELVDPKGKPLQVRLVSRRQSATQESFEYWEERGGKMTKTMEMTFVKQ